MTFPYKFKNKTVLVIKKPLNFHIDCDIAKAQKSYTMICAEILYYDSVSLVAY